MALVARVYLPGPTNIITLPSSMASIALAAVVTVTRGAKSVTGTVTSLGGLGLKPIVTTAQPIGPGRVRVWSQLAL